MLHYLHFKMLYYIWQNLDNFLLMFSRTKLTIVVLWILLVSMYPLSKLGTFPPLTSAMSQDLALRQGAPQMQTASADLWTFSINIPSPWRTQFPLLNLTEFMVPVIPSACYLYCFIIWYLIFTPVQFLALV
jgi:hypothetical protein